MARHVRTDPAPELARLATEAVEADRCEGLDQLIGVWTGLLRRFEAERTAFAATLEAAEEESDRDGWLTADEVHAEMSALVDGMRHAAA